MRHNRHLRRKLHLPRPTIAFETLEPRTLLSGDPAFTAAQQSAFLHGLQDFSTFTAALQQHATLTASLPVISSSMTNQVKLSDQVTAGLFTPIQTYLDTLPAGQSATIEGLAKAVSPNASHVFGQFADGEFLLTLNHFALVKATSQALDLSSDNAGVNLALPASLSMAVTSTADFDLVLGVTTTGQTSSFFIEAIPGASAPTITESVVGSIKPLPGAGPPTVANSVLGSVTGVNTTATIGVGAATVTNGSASLDAVDIVSLAAPTNGQITTSDLQTADLSTLVTVAASTTANVTLPVTSPMVASGASETLTLNWTGTTPGTSNIASLASGQWAALNTTTIAEVADAVADAPTILAAAASSAGGLGASLPLVGTALSNVADFSTVFEPASQALTGVRTLDDAAAALTKALGQTVTFTINPANSDIEFTLGATKDFGLDVPVTVDQAIAGQTLKISGVNAHLSGTADASLQFGVAFDPSLSDADRVSLLSGANSFLKAAFTLATQSPLAAAATLGLLQLQATNATFRIGNGSASVAVAPAGNPNARTTLKALAANAAGYVSPVQLSGQAEADVTLTDKGGANTAAVTIAQDLSTLTAAPSVTGTDQVTALIASASNAGQTATAPKTFAKVQTLAVTPDDTPAPSSDLLSSPVALAQGLNDFLSSLGGDIASDIFDNALPLIGSSLGKAFDFLNTTASNILADAKKDASTVSGVDAVEAFLQSELAPYLKQADGKTASTIGVEYDGVLLAPGETPPQSYSKIAFVLQLGGIAGGSSTLDLDLPSLFSSTDAPTIAASVIWGMTIAVGIDGTGATPTPFVTPQTGLTLSGATSISGGLEGTLIGLTASLKAETTAPDGTKLNNGLTFNAGLDFGHAEISGNSLSNLAPPTITAPIGAVEFHFTGQLGFGSGQIDETLPYFTATLETRTPYTLGGTPDIGLDNISMDLGNALQPVIDALNDVETYVGKIQPILDFLTTPIPVINDITEVLGLGEATVATLLGVIDGDPSFGPAFNKVVAEINDFSSALTAIEKVAQATYSIGSIDFGAVGTTGDPVADDLYDQVAGGIVTDPVPSATPAVANRVTADDVGVTPLNSALAGVKQTLAGYGITAGILDPGTILQLLLGQKGVKLVSVDLETAPLKTGAAFTSDPGIPFPAFPLIEISLSLGGSASFGLGFGYDSTGLDQFQKDPDKDPDDLANGFYIDNSETYANLTLTLSLNALVADIAGLSLVLGNTFDLHFKDPAGTGETRLDDLGSDLQLSGAVSLGIDVTLNLFVTDIEIPIIDVTLLNFDTGGGDTSEVFGTPDANGNLVLFAGPLTYLETPGGVGQYEDAEKDDADINEKLGLSGDQAVHPAEYYIEQFYDDNDNFTVDPVSP